MNKKNNQLKITVIILFLLSNVLFSQTLHPVVPPEWRGNIDAERQGTHDANSVRTLFYNFGMVGDYPKDPLNVDLSIFHSVEIPKGSGENYSDGTTPFVLSEITQKSGSKAYIMETGYRERQGTSPFTNKTMRFEPRFGYFQIDPAINAARSIAMSNDSRTWPDEWYDKLNDVDDPGWKGSWNGYFGKAPKADQESYCVYDDNFYDAWSYYPDERDNTRRGLGLRVEQRGFQWANPQAGYVIFFHYDITNESTTNYDNNIIFGLYMDSGVGGSAISKDGVAESDDDNAFYDKEAGLNLVYTWDKNGNGFKGKTGYLGYSYMETPGNQFDLKDNDDDGMVDERREGGAGTQIIGQAAIRNYVESHYDVTKFESLLGPVDKRPAYIAGVWWTGDEDLDWVAEFYDTGADGVFGTHDSGEDDGMPTYGESFFDKTDIDESDQIGLTGFKMNRIKAGAGNSSTVVDQIVFFDDGKKWPEQLYNFFNSSAPFDQPLVLNYNIGFLFASGPFILDAGKTERFSLAMGFGQNLRELRSTTQIVQQIYKANYLFAVPPPLPTLNACSGDGYVQLTWDNAAERTFDPISNKNDFEGYKIYRSTDPNFLDPQVIVTGIGSRPLGNGKPIAQFDLKNNIAGFSNTTVEGIAYFLGEDTGLSHSFRDTTVINGQRYFYAVCAYDTGIDSAYIYPSENAITVSQTLRGGTILPKNVVEVYPNKEVTGYQSALTNNLVHSQGQGIGTIDLQVLNSKLVPSNHTMRIDFISHEDSVRAKYYQLVDETDNDTLFIFGEDLEGLGTGPAGAGILPIMKTAKSVAIDSANTKLEKTSSTNVPLKVRLSAGYPISYRRIGFPNDINVEFTDSFVDTSVATIGAPARPVKFRVYAISPLGEKSKLKFRFRSGNSTLGLPVVHKDYIEILTAPSSNPTAFKPTWRIEVDTTGLNGEEVIPPTNGDVYKIKVKLPFMKEDKFTFNTIAQSVNEQLSKDEFNKKPYVVPNPYVGAASFEPQRFAVSGRGERKIEFRNLPNECVIKIFTINGELVQTLEHSGNINEGVIEWNLRNKDKLEIAPGLYIFHVDGKNAGKYVGKFAVIK